MSDDYFRLKRELEHYGISKYFDRRNTCSFDVLLEETKEAGIMKEKCQGCGLFYFERDCGCPCGSTWGLSKRHIEEFKASKK